MSYHKCYYCKNESRFICVKCKKDICKDHAFYERNRDGDGEWVCTNCHNTSTGITIVAVIVFIVIIIIAAVVITNAINDFPSVDFPFP